MTNRIHSSFFLLQITHELMMEPVIAGDGVSRNHPMNRPMESGVVRES